MTSSLLFIGITLLLILEGSSIAYLLLRIGNPLLMLSLALPIAAFANVLIVFLCTVTGVALTPLSLIGSHAALFALLFLQGKKVVPAFPATTEVPKTSQSKKILEILCIALITVTTIYSFAHAVLLPTFQYDSATNWTMRSEISFYDRHIAFDGNEDRGMAKPQYPFLFHTLQITVNQGQNRSTVDDLGVAPQSEAGWNDTAANTILWLLSFSAFLSLFLMVTMIRGKTTALVTITMILGIPIVSLHLGQGYADIVLLQEFLLSLACLLVWHKQRNTGWLVLSALFIASSVWTKSEGLFFGLLPWLLVLVALGMTEKTERKNLRRIGGLAILLSIPWQIFAVSKGLLLTPHSGDTRILFHSEGFSEAINGLFDRGSFGIAWYVLALTVPWMIVDCVRTKKFSMDFFLLAWGMVVFAEFIFVYLFTPNVQFLLNAESYYRQMMIPAAMLMLSVCVWFGDASRRTH